MPSERVLPITDDPDSGPFWQAAAEGRLAIKVCEQCGDHLHLPKAFCPRCHVASDTWRTTNGRGRLHSWTVVEHQVHPGYPTPYTVVLVELEEAPQVRLLGMLPGRPELEANQTMTVFFEEVDGVVLPQWEPEPEVQP